MAFEACYPAELIINTGTSGQRGSEKVRAERCLRSSGLCTWTLCGRLIAAALRVDAQLLFYFKDTHLLYCMNCFFRNDSLNGSLFFMRTSPAIGRGAVLAVILRFEFKMSFFFGKSCRIKKPERFIRAGSSYYLFFFIQMPSWCFQLIP